MVKSCWPVGTFISPASLSALISYITVGYGTLTCSHKPQGVSIIFGYKKCVSSQEKLMVNNFFNGWRFTALFIFIVSWIWLESLGTKPGILWCRAFEQPACYCAEWQHLHNPKQTVFLKPLEILDLWIAIF